MIDFKPNARRKTRSTQLNSTSSLVEFSAVYSMVGDIVNKNLAIANSLIARQLRTHYAEGIYRHKYYTVSLKFRLVCGPTDGDLFPILK